jgi:hypothetical protein
MWRRNGQRATSKGAQAEPTQMEIPAGAILIERRGILPHLFGKKDPLELIAEGREGFVDLDEFGVVAHITEEPSDRTGMAANVVSHA